MYDGESPYKNDDLSFRGEEEPDARYTLQEMKKSILNEKNQLETSQQLLNNDIIDLEELTPHLNDDIIDLDQYPHSFYDQSHVPPSEPSQAEEQPSVYEETSSHGNQI